MSNLLAVADHVNRMIIEAGNNEGSAARRNLCYMLTATAIANVGDGGKRSLRVASLQRNAEKLGFQPRSQNDITEALSKLGKEVDYFFFDESESPERERKEKEEEQEEEHEEEEREEGHGAHRPHLGQLLPREERSPMEAWYVTLPFDVSGRYVLPAVLGGTHSFRLGVCYGGDTQEYASGLVSSNNGHYALTDVREMAVLGVYLPSTWAHYPFAPPAIDDDHDDDRWSNFFSPEHIIMVILIGLLLAFFLSSILSRRKHLK